MIIVNEFLAPRYRKLTSGSESNTISSRDRLVSSTKGNDVAGV
jgi:hypothetical protein